MSSPPTNEDAILFRPSKKRKIYRQRATNDEEETETPNVAPTAAVKEQSLDELIASASGGAHPDAEGGDVEDVPVSMSEILRLRRKNKRAGGVEFKASTSAQALRETEDALVEQETAEEEGGLDVVNGVPRRFASQTGAIGDVNKHMMAYIDSEIAKRRPDGLQAQALSLSTQPVTASLSTSSATTKTDPTLTRQPATIGKLQEIDLGDEERSLNVQRTQKAQRMLNGEVVDEEGNKKPAKVRRGPDGRPWRGRKKRGSDDIKRDKLVEDVLRENGLGIYETPTPPAATDPNSIPGQDVAADDRIAEAFRREFMDAVSQRQRKKPAQVQPPTRGAGGKKEEEVLKGPKLGGSRNARQAMRDSMLKAASGKK